MRPGGQGHHPYTQLSYTHRKKGTSYIRPEDLPRVKTEVATCRKIKNLCERLVVLSIELSKLKSTPPFRFQQILTGLPSLTAPGTKRRCAPC
jgi:hypothetical protein